jgi:hypothetical protein
MLEGETDTIMALATRDPSYYIEDGNVVILVGNILFKVKLCALVAARILP